MVLGSAFRRGAAWGESPKLPVCAGAFHRTHFVPRIDEGSDLGFEAGK